jgi:histidyl-tRNA synthetase
LVGLFGAEPISAVGMAPGNTMFENFLQVHGLLPENKSKTNVYIAVIGDALGDALSLASKLRQADINVEVDITNRKLDKQIKTAVKKDIGYLLFVGANDAGNGQYSLKNVENETEETLTIDQIIEKLQA